MKQQQQQSLVFQFRGGFADGQIVRTDSVDCDESHWAKVFDGFTANGTVGRRFRLLSEMARSAMNLAADMAEFRGMGFRYHIYEVATRVQSESTTVVICEFRGHA